MKEVVIFCQAPADVQYALSIYESNKAYGIFHFFAVNVESIYRYLISLNLTNADIQFIGYPNNFNIKNPYSIFRAKKYIKMILNRYIYNKIDCEVYYFSNNYDWLTFCFIAKLSKKNKVFNFDHYSTRVRDKNIFILSAKEYFILLIYACIIGIFLNFEEVNHQKRLFFNFHKFGVVNKNIKVNENLYRKYAYKIENIKSGANVLFFESDLKQYNYIYNYENTLDSVMRSLKCKAVNIYVKPHPRLGYSKFLDTMDVHILPEYVPGEFILLDDFIAVIGIETVVIAKIAKYWGRPAYSILELFDYKNLSIMSLYTKYLTDQSLGRVIFLRSFKDLDKLQFDR